MAREDISAMIIPSNDPHFGEYVQDRYKTIEWLTGFGGEAATLVVTMDKAALWVDSRFFIQAQTQLAGTQVEMMKLRVEGTPSVSEWLKANLDREDIVAMDEELFSYAEYSDMVDKLSPLTPSLIEDPFDEIWKERPALTFNPIRVLDESVTGESVRSKHSGIVEALSLPYDFVYIITALDEIAWLCNIRGTDVEYNPLVISYCTVTRDEVTLFLRQEMLSAEGMRSLLEQNVVIKDYEEIESHLQYLPKKLVRIYSSGKINAKNFFLSMENVHQNMPIPPYIPDPTVGGTLSVLKAVKNPTEIAGFRRAYMEDARAQIKLQKWLFENIENNITEYQVAMKLIEFRSESPDYIGESFPPIVAYGENAALPHYIPLKEKSAVIAPKGLLLIDTGGQYTYGTTDTTRTIPVGPLSQEEKDDYTAVLKGMIDLSIAVFFKGMRGSLLDILARGPVMKRRKMYWHGTSHGIGHNLCVHEGPQSIRMEENQVPLSVGMVISNEPAIYVEGKYGIRHENTMLVKSSEINEYGEFLEFETLTLLPIDLSPVNYGMLEKSEKEWVEKFNEHCATLLK